MLFIQPPSGAVLGVFHLKSEGGQFVADAVARGPVFVGLGLRTNVEEQVDGLTECLFAAGVAVGFGGEAEDVEAEGAESSLEGFETFGRDACLLVCQLVDGAAGIEKVADGNG